AGRGAGEGKHRRADGSRTVRGDAGRRVGDRHQAQRRLPAGRAGPGRGGRGGRRRRGRAAAPGRGERALPGRAGDRPGRAHGGGAAARPDRDPGPGDDVHRRPAVRGRPGHLRPAAPGGRAVLVLGGAGGAAGRGGLRARAGGRPAVPGAAVRRDRAADGPGVGRVRGRAALDGRRAARLGPDRPRPAGPVRGAGGPGLPAAGHLRPGAGRVVGADPGADRLPALAARGRPAAGTAAGPAGRRRPGRRGVRRLGLPGRAGRLGAPAGRAAPAAGL
ncbi:MAG: TesB-like acyl-CoA thioesterase 3, partial [uncultured Corynebacteriales bacterium]